MHIEGTFGNCCYPNSYCKKSKFSYEFYQQPDVAKKMKAKRLTWAGYVERVERSRSPLFLVNDYQPTGNMWLRTCQGGNAILTKQNLHVYMDVCYKLTSFPFFLYKIFCYSKHINLGRYHQQLNVLIKFIIPEFNLNQILKNFQIPFS